jgi:1,3-beta-glucan synthase
MKQTKLRRRRVIRYAILYFVLLIVFLAITVGPGVAGKYIGTKFLPEMLTKEGLLQPTGLNNNDTRGRNHTGTGAPGRAAATASTTTKAARAVLF